MFNPAPPVAMLSGGFLAASLHTRQKIEDLRTDRKSRLKGGCSQDWLPHYLPVRILTLPGK
jgi:hypothetical protein